MHIKSRCRRVGFLNNTQGFRMLRTLIFVVFAALVPQILAICSQPGSIAIGEVASNSSGTPVSSLISISKGVPAFVTRAFFTLCSSTLRQFGIRTAKFLTRSPTTMIFAANMRMAQTSLVIMERKHSF